MLQVCDGPTCRLRARDLGLRDDGGAERVGCLGQCDAPVAVRAPGAARLLAIGRRGFGPEPVVASGAQRGTEEPMLLRDVFFADQGDLTAARRRGAYRGLSALDADSARALTRLLDVAAIDAGADWVLVDAAPTTPGDFAARPLAERDPHLLIEGACLAARALGAGRAVLRVRESWPQAQAALAAAAQAARAAELCAGVMVAVVPASRDEHDGEFHGSIEGAFVLGAAHAARLARAATIAAAGNDPDDGLARAHAWWPAHMTRLCAVSGDVARPGVYELSVRATVGHAVGAAGGVIDGVRAAVLGQAIGDGAWITRDSRGLPTALVAFHRGRDVGGIL